MNDEKDELKSAAEAAVPEETVSNADLSDGVEYRLVDSAGKPSPDNEPGAAAGGRENKAMLAGAIILLLVGALISYSFLKTTSGSPGDVTRQYLETFSAKKYNLAYDLTSKGFQNKCELSQFALLGVSLRNTGMDLKEPKITGEKIDGDKAVVNYSIKFSGGSHGGADRVFDKGEARLKLENGTWKLYWILGMPDSWLEKNNK